MAGTTTVGVLRAVLTADTAEFDDALKRAADQAKRWADKLGDAGKSAGQMLTEGVGESVAKLASAFSVAHFADKAIEGLFEFGKAAFEAGSQTINLSNRLGMSTDAIQRFAYVAHQGEASTEDFANAAFKLGVNIEKGGTEIEAALRNLGLTRDQLRSMKPEEQMDVVARALGDLTDAQERNRDGSVLMGKGYKEIAEAILIYKDKVGEATVVDRDRLEALDETAKAYDRLKDKISKGFTNAIGGSVLVLEEARKSGMSWFEVLGRLNDGTLLGATAAAKHAKALEDEAKGLQHVAEVKQPPPPPDYVDAMAKARAELDTKLTASDRAQIDAALKLGATMDELRERFRLSADAAKIYSAYSADLGKKQDELKKKSDQATEAVKKQKEALEKAGRAISVNGVTDAIAKMNDELKVAAKYGGLNQDAIAKYGKEIDKWLDQGYKVPPVLSDIHYQYVLLNASQQSASDSMKTILAVSKDLTPEFKRQGAEAEKLAEAMGFFDDLARKGATAGNILKTVMHTGQSVTLSKPEFTPTFGKQLSTSIGLAVPDMLGTIISGSLQGGRGGMGQAAVSVGGQVGNMFAGQVGKSITASMTSKVAGSVAGMGATIAGGAASMGISVGVQAGIAGVQALIKHNKNNTLADRKEFAKQIGFSDLGALYSDLQKLGAQGEKLADIGAHVVGKNDQAANQKWMNDVSAFYQKLQDDQKKAVDDVNKLGSSLEAFGGVIPKSLGSMVDELEKVPGMSADMKTALEGMRGDPTWQTLQQKASDLGISLASLGTKFQESKIHDIAFGYIHDLEMFADAGADMTGVLAGMSDELSGLYQDAVTTGVALPDTLKPYMEKLVESGQLLDENGDKVTDLSKVGFAHVDDTALKDVVDVLKEIKDLLSKGLPQAAKDGAKDMQDAFNKNPLHVPVTLDQPNASAFGHPSPSVSLSGGTHGEFVDWGVGTPAILHGRERVMTEGEIGGLGGQPIEITVVSQLDGRQVARNQVRYIPRELALSGV